MAGTPFGPGSVLAGRFTLDDLLAESDGARFWRATDLTLARSVAVHVLPGEDPRASTLLTAARTSALVSDGHLLRVLDAAEEDGVVYVVNEWGSGISFDRLLGEGPLSPRRAAWVVKEVAEAIATAHRNGVAHGRLLPENVMISEAGSVKLIGFVIDAVLRSDAGPSQRRVTGGEPMSALESDVVNLAGLLYAALVGRWPGSEGSSIPAAPSEHGRPLRPRRVRAGVPRPLDAICERVLNSEAHQHMLPIETAHEIFAALSDYIGDPGAASVGDNGRPEPTTALERADLPGGVAADDQDDEGTSDLPASGAMSALDEPEDDPADEPVDPEATRAGAPVFVDDPDTAGGWTSSRRTTPAPPPPPPDLPERPLFADGPSAAAAAAAGGGVAGGASWRRREDDTGSREFHGGFAGTQRSTGAGNGSVPRAWGPDLEESGSGDDEWDEWDEDATPGRSWQRLGVVLAVLVLVVVGLVFAFNLDRGSRDDPQTAQSGSAGRSPSVSASKSVAVPVSGVTDFDPQGDPPEENPDLTALAVDGKQSTAWQTLTYRGNPKLGGLKDGVGLLVDLGKPAKVGEVKLTLIGSLTSLDLLAAPDAAVAPSSTDGLTTVASADGAGTDLDLTLKKPLTTRWLVVWLTSLPSAVGGFKGQVAEISVRS